MTSLPFSDLNNAIAIQFEDEVGLGSIDWIQGEELQLQADAKIERDDVVEMRMELTGWPEAVYCVLKILQRTRSPDGGDPRFLASIVRIEEHTLALLNRWLLEHHRGPTHPDPNLKARLSSLELYSGTRRPEEIEAVMKRYEERKGRLRKEFDIYQDPFGLTTESPSSSNSMTNTSSTRATAPQTRPQPAESKEPSGYLKAMEKRRQARRRVESSPPKKDDFFPPPPPAALSPKPQSEPEDDFFPPPPDSILRRESVAPAPVPVPPGQPDMELHEGTLTLFWSDHSSYQVVLADLLNGKISIPNPGGEVLRLKLKLPNHTEIALRIKRQDVVGEQLELILRLNMVLSSKLREAAN